MPNKKFTSRLNIALGTMLDNPGLRSFEPKTKSLYSPIYRGGKFVWAKVMDSDGVLLSFRKIHNHEGAGVTPETELLIGVVIQSEDATSQTKPNPIGKACLAHIANGIWVNVDSKTRRRIDILTVAFVLPEGASSKDQKSFSTARRNVLNASDFMPNAISIEVPRVIGEQALAAELTKRLRSILVGRGRPAGDA